MSNCMRIILRAAWFRLLSQGKYTYFSHPGLTLLAMRRHTTMSADEDAGCAWGASTTMQRRYSLTLRRASILVRMSAPSEAFLDDHFVQPRIAPVGASFESHHGLYSRG